jgi:hypothetical protein
MPLLQTIDIISLKPYEDLRMSNNPIFQITGHKIEKFHYFLQEKEREACSKKSTATSSTITESYC